MKKWSIAIGTCLLSLIGADQVNNQFEVEIALDDTNQLVFETKSKCEEVKNELIDIFEGEKKLTPDQAVMLKIFQNEQCGVLFEKKVPLGALEIIIAPDYTYKTLEIKNTRKSELTNKYNAKTLTDFREKRELIGIIQVEKQPVEFTGQFNLGVLLD